MDTLTQVVLATFAAGALSVVTAAAFSFVVVERWIPRLVSFAVGAMLAAALLNLLPEAVEAGLSIEDAGLIVLIGLLVFFTLEKLTLWHHDHSHPDGTTLKVAGPMVLIGDALHNFVDGVLIAAAFLQDVQLGIAATLAVIAHEIPQEIGDFVVLLASGFTKRRALVFNLACSLTAVVGGVLGYFLLHEVQSLIPYVLALAAGSFIYIAVADLVPELHHGQSLQAAPLQIALIIAGGSLIAFGHPAH